MSTERMFDVWDNRRYLGCLSEQEIRERFSLSDGVIRQITAVELAFEFAGYTFQQVDNPRWNSTIPGQTWWLEIESDSLSEEVAWLVSINFSSGCDAPDEDSYINIRATPQQAREIAAELIKAAERVERHKEERKNKGN